MVYHSLVQSFWINLTMEKWLGFAFTNELRKPNKIQLFSISACYWLRWPPSASVSDLLKIGNKGDGVVSGLDEERKTTAQAQDLTLTRVGKSRRKEPSQPSKTGLGLRLSRLPSRPSAKVQLHETAFFSFSAFLYFQLCRVSCHPCPCFVHQSIIH